MHDYALARQYVRMTPRSRTSTRRIFLGGVLLAGATAAHSRTSFANGSGSDAKNAARRAASRGAIRPQSSYRLQPQAGAQSPGLRPSTSVTYTLEAAEGRRIALTFDDGPDPVYTPQILDVLRRYKVPATFCVLGENAVLNPGLLQAIADGGHLIANHSWSHPALPRLSTAKARKELSRTSELIEDTVGSPPMWARAPYGYWSEETLELSAGLGMSPLGWSVDTGDWRQPGVPSIVSAVVDNVRAGSIVLSHDGGADAAQTVAALHDYLPQLIDEGWTLSLPPVDGPVGAYRGDGAGSTPADADAATSGERMRPAAR
ncbi:polysaccharide deacetylase family protein [Streptomyces daqingensis]|uniref:polysaccharide deacetylase family protein n=1 Tax=Streptomyces daqingensis TaxID=1472640 RepID=UPI001666A35E|nr:polysaccharide deacetylase family protein [Streptomyces daqingensis]